MKICQKFLHIVSGFIFACGLFLIAGKLVNALPFVLVQNRSFNSMANPIFYLFEVLFILFLISPPIIALMLFLIWTELRKRNQLK